MNIPIKVEKISLKGSWVLETDEEGQGIDPCQPPSTEVAITGHWPVPAGCR